MIISLSNKKRLMYLMIIYIKIVLDAFSLKSLFSSQKLLLQAGIQNGDASRAGFNKVSVVDLEAFMQQEQTGGGSFSTASLSGIIVAIVIFVILIMVVSIVVIVM